MPDSPTIETQPPLQLSEWCAELTTRDGTKLRVRPASAEDEPLLDAFFGQVDPDDIRFRFLSPMPRPGHDLLARLAGVDHVRNENFLAFTEDGETLAATAMIAADDKMEEAEVAISVRSDHRHKGVGWTMLEYLGDYAERRGFRAIVSYESADNRETIALEHEMGFTAAFCPDDPRLVLVRKTLGASAAPAKNRDD
ncbi:MAG TPA: GNAT family N-acetyltransferase [Allosphingosinicella sp.]|jgi:GNAT superfamily N-acetyltransferase